MSNELTTAEAATLRGCEGVIERGKKTFIEVGNALATICDDRLYRATHATFGEYMQDRWGWTDRFARMQIAAAEVVENIKKRNPGSEKLPILPTSEKQARALAKLPAAEQAEAWGEAVEAACGEQPKAKQVKQAVEKRQAEKAPKNGAESWSETVIADPYRKFTRAIDDFCNEIVAGYEKRIEKKGASEKSKRARDSLETCRRQCLNFIDAAKAKYLEWVKV